MAVNIILPQIVVNSVNRGAIAVGENNQPHWSAHAKSNYGNGQFFGTFTNPLNINTIIDNDVIDSPIIDPDVVPSPQSQEL